MFTFSEKLDFFQYLLLVGIFVLTLFNADLSAAPSDSFVSEDRAIELRTVALQSYYKQSERQSLGHRLNPIHSWLLFVR